MMERVPAKKGDVWGYPPGTVRAMLASPWIFPAQGPDRARAFRVRPQGPRTLEPGEVLLVSVTEGGERVGLHALSWGKQPERIVPFDAETRGLLARTRSLATAHLPVLHAPERLARPLPEGARPWVCEGPGCDAWLRGSSFGLAFLLSAVSTLAGESLPPTVVYLASLDFRGRLAPVDRLGPKLSVLARWALGVTEVVVSTAQAGEAREFLQSTRRSIRVNAVGTPREAVAAFLAHRGEYGGSVEHRSGVGSSVGSGEEAAERAHRLFTLALEGSPLLMRWAGIAGAARLIENDHRLPPIVRWKAGVARAIADRHDGRPGPLPLERARLRELRRPIRLRLLAHAVQSEADHSLDDPDRPGDGVAGGPASAVALAQENLASEREESPADLRLLGSLGRWHAAAGEPEKAIPVLVRAVRAWCELDLPQHAAPALSEYLRLLGEAGRGQALATCLDMFFVRCRDHPQTTTVSRGFLELAAGRASLQAQRPTRAGRHLAPLGLFWGDLPLHLQASRLRWLARWNRESQKPETASRCLRELERLAHDHPEHAAFALQLARLDHARHTSGDPRPALEALRTLPTETAEVSRLLRLHHASSADPQTQARVVCEHYRY